jgi:hypothetical protein
MPVPPGRVGVTPASPVPSGSFRRDLSGGPRPGPADRGRDRRTEAGTGARAAGPRTGQRDLRPARQPLPGTGHQPTIRQRLRARNHRLPTHPAGQPAKIYGTGPKPATVTTVFGVGHCARAMIPQRSGAIRNAPSKVEPVSNRTGGVMSAAGLAASRVLAGEYGEVARSLGPEEWSADCQCPGWSVKDLVAHTGSNFRVLVEPPPAAEPVPGLTAERAQDALVDERGHGQRSRYWPSSSSTGSRRLTYSRPCRRSLSRART